jgi:hypothetical protein
VLLEVLLAGGDELDGSELEAAVLEAGDDGANEATLWSGLAINSSCCLVFTAIDVECLNCSNDGCVAYLDAIRLDSNEAVPNN